MNKVIRDQWAAALESGEYPQGKNCLRAHDGKWCCLGVLCDLAARAGIGRWVQTDGSWEFDADGYRAAAWPPDAVVRWAGLPDSNPMLDGAPAAGRNDQGDTFEEIARLIREHL